MFCGLHHFHLKKLYNMSVTLILFISATTTTLTVNPTTISHKPAPVKDNLAPAQSRVLNDLPWSIKIALMKETYNTSKENCASTICTSKDMGKSRRVGVAAFALPASRQDTLEAGNADSDDNNMKMKLFRLMYETVRDSDLKVKRADLIQKSYVNSTTFEVGYLMGDITDKFNIMTDITLTLKRLYHEWKPIEHINAYEQVATLAIDMGHIVDMIKSLEEKLKKEEEYKKTLDSNMNNENVTLSAYFQIN